MDEDLEMEYKAIIEALKDKLVRKDREIIELMEIIDERESEQALNDD